MASLLIQEPFVDPVATALFDSFFDSKRDMDIWEGNLFDVLDLDDVPAPIQTESSDPAEKVKIVRKRKSLGWDTKPLEKRSTSQQYKKNVMSKFCLEAQNEETPVKRKRGRPRKYPRQDAPVMKEAPFDSIILDPFPFDLLLPSEAPTEDVNILSDLFLSSEDSIKPVSKQLMKSRKSEDWSSKPAGQTKRRMKWSNSEMKLLWEGIAKHGNNWTAIRGHVHDRSYCQIKDKGRRCLFLLGWETGRSKAETESSSIRAKKLAREVLAKMRKA